MYDALVNIIGTVPTGSEPLIYVICALILIQLMFSLLRLLTSLFGK